MNKPNSALAGALNIIGDKWSLLIIRNLLFFDHHEYKDFLSMPEKISTNILANRLKKLKDFGLITHIAYTKYPNRKLYYLTPSGKDLIFTMYEIILWGNKNLDNVDLTSYEENMITNQKHAIDSLLIRQNEWEKNHLTI